MQGNNGAALRQQECLFADAADVLANTEDVSGNATIMLDANNKITLEGVLKSALDQDDFSFVRGLA